MKSIIIIYNIIPFPYSLKKDNIVFWYTFFSVFFLVNIHTYFLKVQINHIVVFRIGEGNAKVGRFSQKNKFQLFKKKFSGIV